MRPISGTGDAANESGSRTGARGTPFPVAVARDPHVRATLVGFLGGPVIWISHFMFVYVIAEAGCTGDGRGLDLFDPPVTAIVTLAVTVVACVACLANARGCFRRWRRTAREHAETPKSHRDDGSLSFVGFLLSGLFFLATLAVGTSAAVFTGC
jgi:hypothetical protein